LPAPVDLRAGHLGAGALEIRRLEMADQQAVVEQKQ
jgi:hypothetical protein